MMKIELILLLKLAVGYYNLENDVLNNICPEEPSYPIDGAELEPCRDDGKPTPKRRIAFYLLKQELQNHCYYQTQYAMQKLIEAGISKVNESFGIELTPYYLNDGCSPSQSLNTAIQNHLLDGLNCFDIQIGLTCDLAFERTSEILKSWNSPIVAPYVRNAVLENRFETNSPYSLSIRTGLHTGSVRNYIDWLMKFHIDMSNAVGRNAWDRANLVAPEYSTKGLAQSIHNPGDCAKLLRLDTIESVKFTDTKMYQSDEDILENINHLLEVMHDNSRVQLWCCQTMVFITAMKSFYARYGNEVRRKQWAIFFFDPYISYQSETRIIEDLSSEFELLDQIKVISLDNIKTSYYASSTAKCTASKEEQEDNAIAYSYMDAVYLYGYILNENSMIQAEPVDFLSRMRNRSLSYEVEAKERIILMDNNGDQGLAFALFCVGKDKKWNRCLTGDVILTTTGSIEYVSTDDFESFSQAEQVIWPSGIADNNPKCGYDRSSCLPGTELTLWEFSLTIIGSFLFLTILFALTMSYIRSRAREREIEKLKWILNDYEVTIRNTEQKSESQMSRRSVVYNTWAAAAKMHRSSVFSITFKSISGSTGSVFSNDLSTVIDCPVPKSRSITTGVYLDAFVAVKQLPEYCSSIAQRSSSMNSKFQTEIEQIRELCQIQHSHLTRFFGIYKSSEQPASLITEYGSKGSLTDLLEDKDTARFNLTWEMKKCLMFDIIQGLNALHKSSVKYHGHLKSTNCIVDGRLTVKIADYGIQNILTALREDRFRESLQSEGYAYTEMFYRSLLWMAPEKIKEYAHELTDDEYETINVDHITNVEKEQSADIYSFGIICQEIMYRKGVFFRGPQDRSTAEETIRAIFRHKLKPYSGDIDNIRLSGDDFNDLIIPPNIRGLVNACWEYDWKERLPKCETGKMVDALSKNMHSSSLVESLLDRMEDYSCHLEDLVEERTIQYKKEKERADELLYRMLPKCIADDMKAGQPLKPRTFDDVTVFFSDIMDFSLITHKWQNNPTEIVRMLDRLYTLFDSITEQFDLYKVETIGADYMVVSGCPEPKVDPEPGYYAAEIAKFSIELMSKVKHELELAEKNSDDSIWLSNLRIGFHSGQVVAGVVGQKMPRYCLFGDTVNTASRMKSNGLAQKIHVSEQSYYELKRWSQFSTTYRGIIPLKNRGNMKCYWLEWQKQYTESLLFQPQTKTYNKSAPVARAVTKRTTVDFNPGYIDRNSYGSSKSFLCPEEPSRRQTTNSVRFTNVDQTFDDLREEMNVDVHGNGRRSSVHKSSRGGPNFLTITQPESSEETARPSQQTRSLSQSSEQKESGYFSNSCSTALQLHDTDRSNRTRAQTKSVSDFHIADTPLFTNRSKSFQTDAIRVSTTSTFSVRPEITKIRQDTTNFLHRSSSPDRRLFGGLDRPSHKRSNSYFVPEMFDTEKESDP